MNNIQLFSNEELGIKVRTVLNEDGSISINAEDTAIGFGWTQEKNGKIYVKWERLNDYCKEFGFSPQVGKDDYIPESLYYMLGMKASNERALTYQKWLAMDVLPSIRKTGTYNSNKPKCIEDVLIESLQEMKAVRNQLEKQDKDIAAVQSNVEGIREIVALNPNDWRKESSALINKMALNCGGYEHIKVIREESYKLLEQRYGVALNIRLTNKKKTMALNGVCKSKLDKLNQLDVIGEDKKLIEGYTAIIKEMAIKYKVA